MHALGYGLANLLSDSHFTGYHYGTSDFRFYLTANANNTNPILADVSTKRDKGYAVLLYRVSAQ